MCAYANDRNAAQEDLLQPLDGFEREFGVRIEIDQSDTRQSVTKNWGKLRSPVGRDVVAKASRKLGAGNLGRSRHSRFGDGIVGANSKDGLNRTILGVHFVLAVGSPVSLSVADFA